MKNRWPGKIFRSVFTKLFLVILITGVCINLLVAGFIRLSFRNREDSSFRRGVFHYVNYLIHDLGSPPDPLRALEISRKSSIDIRYESPDRSWSTSENLFLPPQMTLKRWKDYPDVQTGRYHGRHFLVLKKGNGRFIFEIAHTFDRGLVSKEILVILIVLLTVTLAGAYLLIRHILSPVRKLKKGVNEVSKANLSYRVPVKGSDELAELAETFNIMTSRIRGMLHAKEQLMIDVSHELRSPLSRIKVAVESIPEGKAMDSIREDILEMEKMITEILDTYREHYRHGRLNLESVNIIEVLKECVLMFNDQDERIQLSNLPQRVPLQADRDRIKTVFKNILDNALKYSGKSKEPVKVSLDRDPPYTIIRIHDSGPGISSDELPHVYEPFYRVEKSRSRETGGYGLGLSLCKTIMEAHQGKIEIESRVGIGTTVSLYFLRNQ